MYTQKIRLNDGAIVLHKRGHIYHMQIKIGTKYIRETCGTSDIETAKSIAYSRYDDLRIIVKDGGTIAKSPKVKDLVKPFYNYLDTEFTKKKEASYRTTFEKYFLFQLGNKQLQEITEHTLLDWLTWRKTILTPKKTVPTSSTIHNN